MTDERFQLLIEQIRIKKLKKIEREEKKKAILREKKRKAREKARKQEKAQHKEEKPHFQVISRTFSIYQNRYIERETAEDDLYATREELEKAMPNNINWKLWDKLIEQLNDNNANKRKKNNVSL